MCTYGRDDEWLKCTVLSVTEFTQLMTRIQIVITAFDGAESLIHLVPMIDVTETSCQALSVRSSNSDQLRDKTSGFALQLRWTS